MADDAHHAEPPAMPRQRAAIRFLEILLIVMVFLAVGGEPPPHDNEAHYLCRLKHYWNPDWCAGDLFLESADAQLAFIWTFGWVTRWLSLPATAWVGRVLAWTLLAWAWQRLSWRLVPRPLAAVLSAALWVTFNGVFHLAGEWLVGGVEAKCFAFVFVVLALRELVDQRWGRVCLFLGAAMAFHPLVGGWSAVVCGGIWALSKWRELQIANCKSLIANWKAIDAPLPGLIGGGLLALLGIVPALALTWNEPAEIVAEANRIYVFERLPHHLALLSLRSDEMIERFTRHMLLLIGLGVLTWIVSARAPSTKHSARCPVAAKRSDLRCIVQFAWGAVLLAVVGLVIEIVLRRDPLVAGGLQRYYWYRLTDFAVPLGTALVAVALLSAGLERRSAWAVWGLAAALAFTGWHLSDRVVRRLTNPVPPADRKLRDNVAWANFVAWRDVCQWIAAHTEEDALFLTPRSNLSFKWQTGRPEVVTHKDIPQDARSIVEWFQRYQNVYYQIDGEESTKAVRSLGHLGTERVRQLARQYGAKYVVTDQRKPLWLPVVYPTQQHLNFEYVVYRIPDDETPDRSDRNGD